MGRDQRPHVELAIHWSPANIQQVLALVATGAECTLLHENPEKFLVPEVCIDDYGGQSVRVKAVWLSLGIGHLPSHPPLDSLSMFSPS